MKILAGKGRGGVSGPLTVRIHGDVVSGFGGFGNRLACGLVEAGHEVEVVLLDRDERHALLPEMVRERVVERPTGNRVLTVGIVSTPPLGVGQEAMLTMWEAPRLKRGWIESLNRMEVVMAPSRQQVMLFEANGVLAPVRWCPLCVDEVYYREGSQRLLTPSPTKKFTFGAGGDRMHGQSRKGIDLVIQAFRREFRNGEAVRLRVKLRPGCATADPEDERIELIKRFLSPDEMVEFYRSCDVWVDGSRFEGWGLMQQEAQLSGLPVIGQGRIGGVSEFFHGLEVGYQMVEAGEAAYAGMGSWPELDEEDLGRRMREAWSYAKGKIVEMGERARNLALRFDRAGSVRGVEAALAEVGMLVRERGKKGGVRERMECCERGEGKVLEGAGRVVERRKARRKEAQFYHAGDIGDLIYGLLTMEKLGGGNLLVGPECRLEGGLKPRVGIKWETYLALKPLLERQEYVRQVSYAPSVPMWGAGDGNYDLNVFRYYWRGHWTKRLEAAYQRAGKELPYSLAWMHLAAFGIEECNESEPWLKVPETERIRGFPVVMHRSRRYHNPSFPWKDVCEVYAGKMTFIGFESEWRAFVDEMRRTGLEGDRWQPRYYRVRDFWEMARILAGCELFIGNQSSVYAIAEGLKVRTIQETRVDPVDGADCVFRRENAQYVKDGIIRF